MDCPSSPAGHMYQSSAHRRSCTTQSDPVNKPGPAFSDENTIMAMSPQEMPQTCQAATEQFSQPLPVSYSSQPQDNSYTASEPLTFFGSPLSSQLTVRQQTWPASPATAWIGEASNHAYTSPGTPRELSWNSLSQGGVQTCVPVQHYQQAPFRGQSTYHQPGLYRPTMEQSHSYGPRNAAVSTEYPSYYNYHSMSPPTSRRADLPIEGYAGAAVSTVPSLPPYRRPLYEPVSSVSPGVRSMEAPPSHGLPSSPYSNPVSDDERQQTPMSDEDDFSVGPTSGHFAKADPDECIRPSAKDEEKDLGRASSVPASPDTNKPVETPYAQLIYQALMSTPRHAMKLQEIYQWFIQNTDKGKTGQGTGWQNSVRHNLSMNGAFERRPIKDAAIDGDCSSPTGTSKPATEWVLVDEYVDGVLSTTRYRNASRRSQNKKLRSNRSRAPTSSHRSSRRRVPDRSGIPRYSLPPPVSRYDLQLRDYRSDGHYASAYDNPADQLQRLSLSGRPIEQQRRALCYTGGNDYEQAEYQPASHLGSQLEASMHGSSYALAPLNYSSELFMPSVPGAPTVASEDDVNEVITPEASYSVLEPTVLLPGDSSNSSSAHLGPTSDPYNNSGGGGSAYYGLQHGANSAESQSLVPRYTLGDVAGVCDEDMLRSCGWNSNQPSHQ